MKRKPPAPPRVRPNRDAVWELLEDLGMSKNELTRRCGLSPAHLSLLMAGRHSPSPRTRRRCQQVLGVGDYDSLFILEPAEDQRWRTARRGRLGTQKGPHISGEPGMPSQPLRLMFLMLPRLAEGTRR